MRKALTLLAIAGNPQLVSQSQRRELAMPISFIGTARADGFEEKSHGDPWQDLSYAELWHPNLGLELDISIVGDRRTWYIRVYKPATQESADLDIDEPYDRAAIFSALRRVD